MNKTERIQVRLTDFAYRWLKFKKSQTGADYSTLAGMEIEAAARRDKDYLAAGKKGKK